MCTGAGALRNFVITFSLFFINGFFQLQCLPKEDVSNFKVFLAHHAKYSSKSRTSLFKKALLLVNALQRFRDASGNSPFKNIFDDFEKQWNGQSLYSVSAGSSNEIAKSLKNLGIQLEGVWLCLGNSALQQHVQTLPETNQIREVFDALARHFAQDRWKCMAKTVLKSKWTWIGSFAALAAIWISRLKFKIPVIGLDEHVVYEKQDNALKVKTEEGSFSNWFAGLSVTVRLLLEEVKEFRLIALDVAKEVKEFRWLITALVAEGKEFEIGGSGGTLMMSKTITVKMPELIKILNELRDSNGETESE